MGTDLAVIYSPVGGGHKAAALAIVEAARARGLEVELLDAFEHAPRVFGEAYLTAHLTGQGAMPNLYGSAYFAANHRDGAFEPVRRGFDHLAFLKLLKRVCAMAPRAVIATHHLPLVVLGRARRRGWLHAPLVGVVTDYTSHACWAEPGVDGFCVPCPLARHEILLHGVEPDRVAMTGIPVRGAFERIAPVRDVAPGEPLRVLVTSGGFGVGPMRHVVRSFAGVRDVELTVVCGNARGLVERVTRTASQLGVRARVLGFERDMPARVAEAHLVIGKAGGLTVSETMAAGRPMVIVGAVPGNEKINEEHVTRAGAGVAALPHEVGRIVAALRDRRMLASMGARAKGLVVASSASRVIDWTDALVSRASQHAAA
jgi:processive 1,2-diacylglycerol beta-glucosyltransferase